MATTSNTYTGNGSNKLFSVTFPYLDTADIDVFLNGTLQTVTTQYFFANATTVEFVTAPANGATVRLDRSTDDSALAATFFPGSSIKAADLNADFDQTLYVVQEINNKAVKLDDPLYVNKTYIDNADALKVAKAGDTMSGNLAMGGNKVTGLGTPSANADAATKVYVDTVTLAGNVPDGDRGDITVSGVGTSWTIDAGAVVEAKIGTGAVTETKLGTGSVTSAKILDGTILNADVNASAGITADKLSFTQAGTGATARTIDSKLKDTIHVKDFGAVGDGVADDTAAIQAAITAAAGKTLIFDAVTYKTTSTLTISSHGTKLLCRNALIDYYGTAHAIGFGLVGGTAYPVEIEIRDLGIIVNTSGSSSGILLRTSYSKYYNVSIALRVAATSAKGFVLVGDEPNGTGPYYNYFQACSVQSQSAGLDHIGVQFVAIAPGYRGPNANTWIGGRIGQCLTGFYITGSGNSFINPTVENAALTGTAFDFVGGAAGKCSGNNIVNAYIENANIGVRLASFAAGTGIHNPFMTGVTTPFSDAGSETLFITAIGSSRLPTGLKFGTLSGDASVLDYYEEGTWIPTLVGSSTAGSYTLTSGTAKYTRIGRVVHVTFSSSITINTAGTGVARFGGLPFAKMSGTILTGATWVSNVTLPVVNSGISVNAWTSSADSTFYFLANRSGTSTSDILCSDIGAGAIVATSFTYFV